MPVADFWIRRNSRAKSRGSSRIAESGRADNAEPYGLLTHHLVQDEATWSFTATLLEMFAESGVARWTSPLDEANGLQD